MPEANGTVPVESDKLLTKTTEAPKVDLYTSQTVSKSLKIRNHVSVISKAIKQVKADSRKAMSRPSLTDCFFFRPSSS